MKPFIPTFKLKLIAGRNFIQNETKPSIILSRFASERLGFNSPDDAIGSIIESLAPGGWTPEWIKVEVIGVIEDYRMAPYILEEGSSESVTGERPVPDVFEFGISCLCSEQNFIKIE